VPILGTTVAERSFPIASMNPFTSDMVRYLPGAAAGIS
jgi:hypothetical protein